RVGNAKRGIVDAGDSSTRRKLPLDQPGSDVDRVHRVVAASDVKVAVLDVRASERLAGDRTDAVVELGGWPQLPLPLQIKRPDAIEFGPVQPGPRHHRATTLSRTQS